MIYLKTDEEIELLRQANLVVARTLAEVAAEEKAAQEKAAQA